MDSNKAQRREAHRLHVVSRTKRQNFFLNVRLMSKLSIPELVCVAASKKMAVNLRAAALRVLTGIAPVEVTQGQHYAARRLLVRKHFAI
jgi:hypothetical protein